MTEVIIEVPGMPPVHTTTEGIRRAADRLSRSKGRLRASMSDSAGLAQEMADAGLISQEAATETKQMAEAVTDKFAPEQPASLQLKAIIERIERLEEEKKTISDDIRDVYLESKSQGYDPKIMRQIVRLRKQDPNERAEAETILETYMQALGML